MNCAVHQEVPGDRVVQVVLVAVVVTAVAEEKVPAHFPVVA